MPQQYYDADGNPLPPDDAEVYYDADGNPVPAAPEPKGSKPADPGKSVFSGIWDYFTKPTGIPASSIRRDFKQDAENFTRGLVDTASFGTADEAGAWIDSKIDPSKTYEQYRDQYRQELKDSGGAGTVGQLAGGLIMPGAGWKTAAGQGAAYGFGSGDGDLTDRAISSVIGAGTGAAGHYIGGKIAEKASDLTDRIFGKGLSKAISSSEDEFAKGSALYKQAEQEGVRLKDTAVDRLIGDLKTAVAHVDPDNPNLYGQSLGMLKFLDKKAGKDMSLETFDQVRQVISDEIGGAKGYDKKTLQMMKEAFGKFEDSLDTAADVTGDASVAVPLVKQARASWLKGKKLDTLEQAQEQAAMRTNRRNSNDPLRAQAIKINDKVIKGTDNRWTPDEKTLLKDLASGEENWATRLARSFEQKGPVGIAAGQYVGGMFPGGNYIMPMVGTLGAKLAGANETAKLDRLLQAVSNGGFAPSKHTSALIKLLKQKMGGASLPLVNPTRDALLSDTAYDPKRRGGLGALGGPK